jgi:hypothetical protein
LITRRRPIPPPPLEEELVAASDGPVYLAGRVATVAITLTERARSAAIRVLESIDIEQLYLRLEGLETEGDHNVVYGVYIDLPPELGPGERLDDYFAGNLSFFGAKHHRDIRARGDSPLGLTHTLDVTGLVNQLKRLERWNDERLLVTFEPTALTTPEGESLLLTASQDVPHATIGRVSLFAMGG